MCPDSQEIPSPVSAESSLKLPQTRKPNESDVFYFIDFNFPGGIDTLVKARQIVSDVQQQAPSYNLLGLCSMTVKDKVKPHSLMGRSGSEGSACASLRRVMPFRNMLS